MNPYTLRLLFNGATDAAKYLREQGDKRKREVYDTLVAALEERDITDADELEQLYDAARTQAGDLTRAAHDRLDKRRAAFNAALPDREAQRKAWRAEAKSHKKKSKGNGGKILAGILGAGAAAAAGWACWEFWLKDKLAEREPEIDLVDVASSGAHARTGEAKLVYSTSTEDDLHRDANATAGESTGVYAPDAADTAGTDGEDADTYGAHAAKPTTLTTDATDASGTGVDGETMSTMDALDDTQRKGTEGGSTRHSLSEYREDR